ncbi:MAG: hypothetical protein WDO15_28000 [Bacteroidota bacterium]
MSMSLTLQPTTGLIGRHRWSPTSPIGQKKRSGDSLKFKRDSVLAKYKVKFGTVGKGVELGSSNKITVNNQTYTLELNTPNNLVDLHLKGNGKDIILQKDKKIPASRGSIRAYRLHKAYVFGDKIAVFIEYDGDIETGFENERYYNRKYIAVTAVVK